MYVCMYVCVYVFIRLEHPIAFLFLSLSLSFLLSPRLYGLSEENTRIQEFWSHSWRASNFWKVWLLLMLKNGKAPWCLSLRVQVPR